MVQVPTEMPVTMPAALTVAIAGLLLLHMPPAVLSVRPVDVPTQVPEAPLIGETPDDPPTVIVFVT
jgi:hypothetical protein